MLNRNLLIFAISLLLATTKLSVSIFWLYHSHTKSPLRIAITGYSFYWPKIVLALSIIPLALNVILVYLESRGLNGISYILVAAHSVLVATLAGYLWNFSDRREYHPSFGLLSLLSIASAAAAFCVPLTSNVTTFVVFTTKDFFFSYHLFYLLYNPSGDPWNNKQTSDAIRWNFALSILVLVNSLVTLLAYQLEKIDYILGLWMGYCAILVWLLVMLVRQAPLWKRQPHTYSVDRAFSNLGSRPGQSGQSSDDGI